MVLIKNTIAWGILLPWMFFIYIIYPASATVERGIEDVAAYYESYRTTDEVEINENMMGEERDKNDRLNVENAKETDDYYQFAVPTSIKRKTELLYAVDGADRRSDPHLYVIDPSNGAILNDLGPIGFDGIEAIAIEPKTGKRYGVSNGYFRFPMSSELIHMDPASNTTRLVGGDNPYHCTDLAFDTDGKLYGWSENGSDSLVVFDLTTGIGTLVGESGIRTVASGLAFDPGGTLWLKWGQSLYTVDPKTGVPRYRRRLDRFFSNMLTIDRNGVFYTALRNGDVYTFDPQTGASAFVGATGIDDLSALEFASGPESIAFLDSFN